MVFHWSLSDSKSPQVSSTLLSILIVLNYVVVWETHEVGPSQRNFIYQREKTIWILEK